MLDILILIKNLFLHNKEYKLVVDNFLKESKDFSISANQMGVKVIKEENI